MPSPSTLVVKNGSKIRPRWASGMPLPGVALCTLTFRYLWKSLRGFTTRRAAPPGAPLRRYEDLMF